jgi:hypothetical protein
MECKNIATGGDGKRNPKRYLFIPPGDVHDVETDPPPNTELLSHVTLVYLQGDQDTCLQHSMASALTAMGFEAEAKVVAADAALVGCKVTLVPRAAALIQKVFSKSNLAMKKLHNHACSVAEIAKEDASWPLILIIQTSDGSHGTHAVTTWNQMIFYSNCVHSLRWSQRALDWCSGRDSTCVGFSRAYRICPANYGEKLPESAITVGSQVRFLDYDSFGWIMRGPSKKRRGYHVRHSNGKTQAMSKGEVERFLAPRLQVGYF